MKKMLAFILSAVMLLTVLVGCGAAPPGESTPSASQEGEPAPAPSELNAAVFYYDFSDIHFQRAHQHGR